MNWKGHFFKLRNYLFRIDGENERLLSDDDGDLIVFQNGSMLEVECRGCYCCCPCRRPWSIGEPLVDGDDVKVDHVGLVQSADHSSRSSRPSSHISSRKRLGDTLAAANGHWSGLLYWSWIPGDGLSEYLVEDEEKQVDDDRERVEFVPSPGNLGGGNEATNFWIRWPNLSQSQHRFASRGRLGVVALLLRLLLVVALLLLDGNVVIVSVLLRRSIPFGKAIERLWSWPCPFRVCAAPRCNLMTRNGRPLFPRTKPDIKSAWQQSSDGESLAKMEDSSA